MSDNKKFTLVEMIIVIAIVMILAALLFPAIGALRNRSMKDRTKSYLIQLDAAIRQYHDDYMSYPPGAPSSNAWNDIETTDKALFVYVNDAYLAKGDLAATGTVPNRYYIDAWKKALIYVGSGARPGWIHAVQPGFETEFELWSAGPDGKVSNLASGSDDGDNVTVTAWGAP